MVLFVELVFMELFYGLEDLLRIGDIGLVEGLISSKLYNFIDKDLFLYSVEIFLEVSLLYFNILFVG